MAAVAALQPLAGRCSTRLWVELGRRGEQSAKPSDVVCQVEFRLGHVTIPTVTRGIAFLPWVTSDAERLVGRFLLVPYRLGRSENAASAIPHAQIDQALRFYRDASRRPIRQCTLVALADKGIGTALSDAEIEDLFIFGELLAFSALSHRRFFQNGFGYVGRDQYALLFQRIPDHFSGSIALTYRRRDGGMTQGIGADDFPITIPPHVVWQQSVAYDEQLLQALLQAWMGMSAKDWQRYYEAANAFNFANTDSEAVPHGMELVLLHGAFERALGVGGGKTNDFVAELGKCLAISDRVKCRVRGAIQPKPKANEPFVLEAWARDFCASRGSVAHGHDYAASKPTWSLPNHLLLASYLLPLVIKRRLSEAGLMTMREGDVALIDAFERLACFDHFRRMSALTTPPWRRIMTDVELDLLAREMHRRLGVSP